MKDWHVARDSAGWYVADAVGHDVVGRTYPTRAAAAFALARVLADEASERTVADHVDGHDRDDPGLSPDY